MKLSYIRKPSRNFIKAAFLITILGFSMVAVPARAAADTTSTAKVSFTFDDGLSSAYEQAAKVLKPYGYTGTDYIITDCVGQKSPDACGAGDANYMTWDDITKLRSDYGWEIGSHTKTHPLTAAADNKTLTDAQLDDEMSGSQQALLAHGFTATDYASPYGDYDNRAIAASAKYYASHRTFQDLTYSTDADSNTFPYYAPRSSYPYNNYLLTVAEVQGDVSVPTVEQYVDQAKANGQWLILVFHDIKASGASTIKEDYQYNAGDLDQIAAYVKSQNVAVTDVNHGLASGTNIMPNSGFTTGLEGWTTDDAANITLNQATTALAGHGSYDGTPSGPLNSVSLVGGPTDTHLFSPHVGVNFGTTYTLTNFVNVTSTAGEVDFFVDEYDANGVYVGGKYVQGISGATVKNAVQVGDINFTYTPSTAAVTRARLQVIVHGSGTRAYIDNLQWLSPTGPTTPPVDTPPVDNPPVDTPPVDTPPVDTPPVETPPVDVPPIDTPPVVVITPPVDTPPTASTPVASPPAPSDQSTTTPATRAGATRPSTMPPAGPLGYTPTGHTSSTTTTKPAVTPKKVKHQPQPHHPSHKQTIKTRNASETSSSLYVLLAIMTGSIIGIVSPLARRKYQTTAQNDK